MHEEQDIDYYLKRGDIDPPIQAQLTDGSGTPIDLTNAQGVSITMKHVFHDTVVINSAAAVIENATDGVVGYAWSSGDTDKQGLHAAEWTVTKSNGDTESFPNDGYLHIYISDSL